MKLIPLLATIFLLPVPGLPAAPAASDALTADDWRGIRSAWEAERHAFSPDPQHPGQWRAGNPKQKWDTRIDADGFTTIPSAGGWTWGLELLSYGYGAAQQSVRGPAAITADGQRLSCRQDARVEEWFVNDTRGLEHGFTITSAPPRGEAGAHATLDFCLQTRGALTPRLLPHVLGVKFCDAAGKPALIYDGLKVWDADGKILTARFAIEGRTLRLSVDDRNARYPLTIDPIAEQAYLKAPETDPGDEFGRSVAVWGNTVVVGAPNDDWNDDIANNPTLDAGAAFVFVRTGGVWTQQAILRISLNRRNGYNAGYSVAIYGDAIVIGVPDHDLQTIENGPTYTNAGAAVVFHRSGTTWSEAGFLASPLIAVANRTGDDGDKLGTSVAIHGNTVVVGAPFESSASAAAPADNSIYGAGAAYVYEATGGGYVLRTMLKAPFPRFRNEFGHTVAVSGDTIVVGCPHESSSATGINSPNGADESLISPGAAFVFRKSGAAWVQEAYLKPHNTHQGQRFGYSVAIDGTTVVVGSQREATNGTGVLPPTPAPLGVNAGAAYVFVRNGTTWSAQALHKAFHAETSMNFGESVAISGDTILVGAPGGQSWSLGVNSPPVYQAGGYTMGAAYAYRRSGVTWSTLAYLRPSYSHVNAMFGHSVSTSGETMVAGIPGDDSAATGINGPAGNEDATDSGGVCVFDNLATAPTGFEIWRTGIYGARNFGPSNASTADQDGDGLTNLEEFTWGLNPQLADAQNLPDILVGQTFTTASLSEPHAVQGLRYTLQSSATLAPGSWVDETDAGSGRFHSYFISHTGPRKFYRWYARP